MGIFDKLKGHVGAQFLDVIEWTTDDQDVVAWKFPIFNQVIQDGGQLVVREGQAAVFVQEGKLSDVFAPGTYELSTNTPAITSFFDSIAYQFNYPYKGDVYFFSTKRFANHSPAPHRSGQCHRAPPLATTCWTCTCFGRLFCLSPLG